MTDDEPRPLELLSRAAVRQGWKVGIVATARGPAKDRATALEALEVREGTGPRWDEREKILRVSLTNLPIAEAAQVAYAHLAAAEDDAA